MGKFGDRSRLESVPFGELRGKSQGRDRAGGGYQGAIAKGDPSDQVQGLERRGDRPLLLMDRWFRDSPSLTLIARGGNPGQSSVVYGNGS